MNPPPMHLTAHDRLRSQGVAIARWLLACALLCFLMLVIGGLTRLTGSGLSIVEWRPVTGAVPPLDLRDWAVLFEQYRQSPQFRIENAHMTLEGFRRIFWWEYIHRLLGRVTGLVFALPLLWFWRKGQLPATLRVRLPAIFTLGAAQGVMGWLMVKSGLVEDPRVSPVRLALHLGLAFVLVGLLVRTALTVREGAAPPARPPSVLARSADALAATVFVMALSGALVAGNHAGLAFNTWPLMAGSLVPAGLFPLLDRLAPRSHRPALPSVVPPGDGDLPRPVLARRRDAAPRGAARSRVAASGQLDAVLRRDARRWARAASLADGRAARPCAVGRNRSSRRARRR
jgi:cytochrome c oxidase assembly protein subunit 15